MGSEEVSASTSPERGGGNNVPTSKNTYTLTDCFKAVFPYYLSIGMTYDQFWNGEAWLTTAYRQADELRQRRDNSHAWLQGMYVYDAILRAAPYFRFTMKGFSRPTPYVEEPYPFKKDTEKPIDEEDQTREDYELLRAKVKAFINQKVSN